MSVPDVLAQVGGLPEEARGHHVRMEVTSRLAAFVVVVVERTVSRICDDRARLDAERAGLPGVGCVRPGLYLHRQVHTHSDRPPDTISVPVAPIALLKGVIVELMKAVTDFIADRQRERAHGKAEVVEKQQLRRSREGRHRVDVHSIHRRCFHLRRRLNNGQVTAVAQTADRAIAVESDHPKTSHKRALSAPARGRSGSFEVHRSRRCIEGHRSVIGKAWRAMSHLVGAAHALEALNALCQNAAAVVFDLDEQPVLLKTHRRALHGRVTVPEHAILVQPVLKHSGRHCPGLPGGTGVLTGCPERADRRWHREGASEALCRRAELVVPKLGRRVRYRRSPLSRQHGLPQLSGLTDHTSRSLARRKSVAERAARLAEPHGGLGAVDERQHFDPAVEWQQHQRYWPVCAAGHGRRRMQ